MNTLATAFRFTSEDKRILREVAQRLQRTQADTVRTLLRQAHVDLCQVDRVIPVNFSALESISPAPALEPAQM